VGTGVVAVVLARETVEGIETDSRESATVEETGIARAIAEGT